MRKMPPRKIIKFSHNIRLCWFESWTWSHSSRSRSLWDSPEPTPSERSDTVLWKQRKCKSPKHLLPAKSTTDWDHTSNQHDLMCIMPYSSKMAFLCCSHFSHYLRSTTLRLCMRIIESWSMERNADICLCVIDLGLGELGFVWHVLISHKYTFHGLKNVNTFFNKLVWVFQICLWLTGA